MRSFLKLKSIAKRYLLFAQRALYLTILFTIFQGTTMAATLIHVSVKGIKIPVIFVEQKRLPLASMELIFQNSGSLSDRVPGVARLSAAILEEGTSKQGAIAFAEDLESHAVQLHVDAGRETFVISLEALKSEFDFAIKKLTELLRDPNLTQEAFRKVQTQTLGKLRQKESDFDYIAAVKLRSILFKGTPLEHPALGTPKTIRLIKLEDLKDHLSRHLHLDNLIVVIGGKFELDEVKALVKKAVQDLSSAKVAAIEHFSANDQERQIITYEQTDQAYIYFGAPYSMEANDTRRVYGKVAAFILGSGGFGSRLMEEVRVKRGLAYSAYARLALQRTHSYFSGYLQTKLESQDEAQKVVKETIDNFLRDGVSAQELESAKKFFLGSEPLRTETLSQRMSRAFHDYYEGLGLGWSKRELEMIRDMKLEDLNNFIKAHPEIGKLSWSIVTKKKQ